MRRLISSLFKGVKLKDIKSNRHYFYWLILALGQIGMSLGLVKNNHFTAIAGIHYTVFLLIASAFLVFKTKMLRLCYEFLSLLMVGLIYSPNLISWSYMLNQKYLAIVSAALVAMIYFGTNGLKTLATKT